MEHKIYVEVLAVFTVEGKIIPLTVVWADGRRFNIDKVTDIRRKASLKAGGCGIRYTCKIDGGERYLFLEDYTVNSAIGARWFVEAKTSN